jgi:inositol oxygenase
MNKYEGFRNYIDSERQDMVKETYKKNHINMTVDHVLTMRDKWLVFNHGKYSIKQILDLVDTIIDDSDPDTSSPNTVHAFQTAESLREKYPTMDWLHLVGLLHDLGKVMCCWGEPQWNVVGDTYPVGCAFSDKIVFSEFFKDNVDSHFEGYKTKLGIYNSHCGLSNVLMSWGHDEYMYQVLKHNNCKIPKQGLFIIRYHSFYPWHTDGEYKYFTNTKDRIMLSWIKYFNQHDLYTKSGINYNKETREELWNTYYEKLCNKYGIGDLLEW